MTDMEKALKNVLLYLRIWLTNDKNIKIIKKINDAIWEGEKNDKQREIYRGIW